ncbi:MULTISPECIES: ATP-binding cassette domain-containing protein [unclassified Roseitalea]|uniref:ABC transporter ATP-binding protein n=1 Tax=unclassified Roseitalea TaxID=2639107 RepID=UPI00273F78E2|nr:MULTISPECIES: ATP-binding cassette domain-containing protein [unclassified Roseitalea]
MTVAPPLPLEGQAAALARWRDVRVRYPYAQRDAVGPASLSVGPGERVLLLGPSGSGKSTLLQTLTGIIPQTVPATVDGTVEITGAPVESRPPADWADTVAHFFQDADQTLTGLRVGDEVAFALENRALPHKAIAARVEAAMARVGLPPDWRDRRTATLSGGEKQLVALAATLIADAPLFVADEPTASLAPAAAARVYDLLLDEGQGGVLIVDHRLDDLIAAVDRVVVLDGQGVQRLAGPPGPLFRDHGDRLDAEGIWTPLASRLDRVLHAAGLAAAGPAVTVGDLMENLGQLAAPDRRKAHAMLSEAVRPLRPAGGIQSGPVLCRLEGAACAPLFGPVVLRHVTLDIRAGEVLGIVGANGAGKSTLGASLAGLLRLKGGRRDGPVGAIAFQNPENQFLQASVRDELASALDKTAAPDATAPLLERWGLGAVAGQHPFELSQGQKRRLALACLTATDRWPLIVLDEPTSGLDARGAAEVAANIEAIAGQGRAVAVITHDMDFALRTCHRVIVLGEGGILVQGRPGDILRQGALLARADLAPPAIAPVLGWLERTPC